MKKTVLFIIYLTVVFLLSAAAVELYCRSRGICALSQFRDKDFPNNEVFTTSNFLPFEIAPNLPGYTNSLGMRDRERKVEKPAGVKRIIVLGDSVTMYGHYTSFLEAWLNRDCLGQVEVWNCGIGGHGIKDYYYNLLYRGLRYQPDMVIIGFCLNDFSLTPVMFKDKSGKLLCYRPFRILKNEFDNWLYCHSNAYRLILTTWEAKRSGSLKNPEFLGRTYLGRIKALCQARKIPLITIIFPYFTGNSEETLEYEIIKQVNRDLNIDCIDLHLYFNKEERSRFLDNPGDVIHPNDAAHKLVAGILKEHLIEGKYLGLTARDEK